MWKTEICTKNTDEKKIFIIFEIFNDLGDLAKNVKCLIVGQLNNA
jgi:hypothetical protein